MRQWIGSALVQIMACRLFGANPLSKQCWFIVNWTPRNEIKWIFNQNKKNFISENVSGNIVCEMAAILSRGNESTLCYSWKGPKTKGALTWLSKWFTHQTGLNVVQTQSVNDMMKQMNCCFKFRPALVCQRDVVHKVFIARKFHTKSTLLMNFRPGFWVENNWHNEELC